MWRYTDNNVTTQSHISTIDSVMDISTHTDQTSVLEKQALSAPSSQSSPQGGKYDSMH